MKIHWLWSIAVLFAIVVLSVEVHAADAPFRAKVKVTVSADDNIKSAVISYLNRELRSLNDVELVDTDSGWEIDVVVMESKTVDGRKRGLVIFSTVILNHYDNQLLSLYFKPECKDVGLQMTSDLCDFYGHRVDKGPIDDLQSICKDVVANFDTKNLEVVRKLFREMNELQKKSK
ncbi:MAG: hypothetical protein V1933_04265 [Candidatus Omnitrophota bacterium]